MSPRMNSAPGTGSISTSRARPRGHFHQHAVRQLVSTPLETLPNRPHVRQLAGNRYLSSSCLSLYGARLRYPAVFASTTYGSLICRANHCADDAVRRWPSLRRRAQSDGPVSHSATSTGTLISRQRRPSRRFRTYIPESSKMPSRTPRSATRNRPTGMRAQIASNIAQPAIISSQRSAPIQGYVARSAGPIDRN